MPYINEEAKRHLEETGPETAGQLNYAFTKMICWYLKLKGLNYQTCNDIVGALDNAKDEFRRRIQHPYEDRKIAENGDVYGDS